MGRVDCTPVLQQQLLRVSRFSSSPLVAVTKFDLFHDALARPAHSATVVRPSIVRPIRFIKYTLFTLSSKHVQLTYS